MVWLISFSSVPTERSSQIVRRLDPATAELMRLTLGLQSDARRVPAKVGVECANRSNRGRGIVPNGTCALRNCLLRVAIDFTGALRVA